MTRRRNGNGGGDRRPPLVRAIDLGGRVPPSNLEAEACVLSAVLCDTKALDAVLAEKLEAEHFYSDANKRIFEVVVDLHRWSKPVDTQTVAADLRDRDRLQAIGGISYLAKLVDATPAVAHVAAHAKIVIEKARIRRLIETCQMIAASGYGDYGDAQPFIDEAAQAVFEIAQQGIAGKGRLFYDIVKQNVEDTTRAVARGGRIAGYPSGFSNLDVRTGGFFRDEFVLVAARPAMGKSALMLDYADHFASLDGDGEDPECQGLFVHVFEYEMPDTQLGHRRICARGNIDVSHARTGRMLEDDMSSYINAAHAISQHPIWVYDDVTINVLQAQALVRAAQQKIPKRRHVAIFDYLQLMPSIEQHDSEEQRLSEISRSLKLMSRALHIPVIAGAQLNREVEKRAGKEKGRPQLSDLRGSGSLEQDADVVQFIYRPEMYGEAPTNKDLAMVIVAKQRNGPIGDCALAFRSAFTRFENPTEKDFERWRR